MIQNSIETFFESASKKMPDIISPSQELRNKREVYSDNAVVALAPKRPLTISEFIDHVDASFGMVMMYHHIRSRDTEFGQSICCFQEPGTGSMFQIDATCNSKGLITQIDVRVYSSLERMVSQLRDQLHRMNSVSGCFAYKIEEYELLSYFL